MLLYLVKIAYLNLKTTMATVTFKGNPVNIKGDVPAKGKAADFTFVKDDLSEGRLSDFSNKVKVLIAVPSLDTSVCATETRKFNERLAQKENVQGLIISKDLPFAMKRFCASEGIENVINASDFRYGDFSSKYNTEITDGPLKGLSTRAVFVVDQSDNITYTELVPEIGQEPDYDKAIAAVDALS